MRVSSKMLQTRKAPFTPPMRLCFKILWFSLLWSSADSFQQLQPLFSRTAPQQQSPTTTSTTTVLWSANQPQTNSGASSSSSDDASSSSTETEVNAQDVLNQLQNVDAAQLEREMEELSRLSTELDDFLAQHGSDSSDKNESMMDAADQEAKESISRLNKLKDDLNFIQGALDEMENDKEDKDLLSQQQNVDSDETEETAAKDGSVSTVADATKEGTSTFAGMLIPNDDDEPKDEKENSPGVDETTEMKAATVAGKREKKAQETATTIMDDKAGDVVDEIKLAEKPVEDEQEKESAAAKEHVQNVATPVVKSIKIMDNEESEEIAAVTDEETADGEEESKIESKTDNDFQIPPAEEEVATAIAEENAQLPSKDINDETTTEQFTKDDSKPETPVVAQKPIIRSHSFQWREDAMEEEVKMQNVFGLVPDSDSVNAAALNRGRKVQKRATTSVDALHLAAVNRRKQHTLQNRESNNKDQLQHNSAYATVLDPTHKAGQKPHASTQTDPAYAAALDRGRKRSRTSNASDTKEAASKTVVRTISKVNVQSKREERNPRLNINGETPLPTNLQSFTARDTKGLVYNHIKSCWEVGGSGESSES